jgi:pSer/pThr/pTyr-binding forkhead associated (FHA) protein
VEGESPVARHEASAVELQRRIQAEREGLPFLLYRDAHGTEQLYTLEDTASRKITIGRNPDADIPLSWDSEVSSIHAELERIGSSWAIVDDGLSRNGTYVNSERVAGRRALNEGDVLRFGSTVAVYRAPWQVAGDRTQVASDMPAAASLTEAQHKVLAALCRPFKHSEAYATPATNKQIAEELYLSVDAVKTHLRVLFQKFGVEELPQNQKRVRLVELAFQSGTISEREL